MHQWPPCTASFAEATTIEGSMVPRVTSGPSAPKSALCIRHPRAQKRTGRLLEMTMNIDDGCISTWNFGVNVVVKEAKLWAQNTFWGVHIQQNHCRTLLTNRLLATMFSREVSIRWGLDHSGSAQVVPNDRILGVLRETSANQPSTVGKEEFWLKSIKYTYIYIYICTMDLYVLFERLHVERILLKLYLFLENPY